MKKEIKNKYIKELLSPVNKQIKGRAFDGKGGYCGLGLLFKILGYYDKDHKEVLPPGTDVNIFLKSATIDLHQAQTIVRMNEEGQTYLQIRDYVQTIPTT